MNKYITATFSIAVAIGPASALDVGLGGQVGGIGVGAGLGVGSKGVSVGVSTGVGKAAEANVGGTLGTSKGSPGVSAAATGKLGDAGGGVSAGVGSSGASVAAGADLGKVGGVSVEGSLDRSGASAAASSNLGGVGVGVSTGVGSKGVSAAAGVTVGSAGVTGSIGPNAAASDKLGETGGNLSAGVDQEDVSVGVGASAARANSSTASPATLRETAGGTPTAGSGTGKSGIATTKVGPAKGVRQAIALPRVLLPSKAGRDKSRQRMVGYPSPSLAQFEAIPGTPGAVVRVCRQAIASAAEQFGAVRVRAISAGPLSRQRRGVLAAPIQVRIDYARRGGIEVRQARIRCRLDAAGRVVAVT